MDLKTIFKFVRFLFDKIFMANDRFPVILKKIIATREVNFPELLVRLAREGVFTVSSPLQYMLQALPASGFFRPLMLAEDVGTVDVMAADFSRLTGFREEYSSYMFRSFAYAIGVCTVAPEYPCINSDSEREGSCSAEDPSQVYASGDMTCKAWNRHWTEDEKKEFLTALVETCRGNERRLGVRVGRAVCVGVSEYNFRITAELSRQEPGATAALYYAVYGREGEILDTAVLGVLCYDDVSPLPRMAVVPVPPDKVGRILLFWD